MKITDGLKGPGVQFVKVVHSGVAKKESMKYTYNYNAANITDRKASTEWKDLWYQKHIKTTRKIHSLNNFVTRKESPNNELIRRTGDREDWKAIIAHVCPPGS